MLKKKNKKTIKRKRFIWPATWVWMSMSKLGMRISEDNLFIKLSGNVFKNGFWEGNVGRLHGCYDWT